MKKQTAKRPSFQKCLLLVFLAFAIVLSGCANAGGAPDQRASADTEAVQETEAQPSTQTVNPQETCTHQWQNWVLGEKEMTRVCELCQLEESMEIDRGVYVAQLLAGHWDLYGVYSKQTGLIPAVNVLGDDTVGVYFRFDQEGTGEYFNEENTAGVTCQFQEYDAENNSYNLTATIDSDGSEMSLVYDGELNQLLVPFSGGVEVYSQNLDTAEKLTGLWAGSGNGTIISLELHEDRSFTADFGEEFTGTWHLRAPVQYGDYLNGGLGLKYTQDGSTVMENYYLGAYDDEYSFGLELEDGTYVGMEKVDAETLTQMKETAEAGTKAILGQWTSLSVMDYSIDGHHLVTPVSDYTMTFAEDGTFTANLDRERSGTWRFYSLDNGEMKYKLAFEGISEESSLWLSPESGESSISNFKTDRQLTLAKMTEEKKAALAADAKREEGLIAGDWNSFSVQSHNSSTPTMDFRYTLSFNPDGTFTSNLEGGSTGRWEAVTWSDNWYYYLETDETGKKFYCELSEPLTLTDSGRDITFGQYSEEELKIIEEGTNQLIGSWSSENNSVTIRADGTFTSTTGILSSGTWKFRYYKKGELMYRFYDADGNGGYAYTLSADGILHDWNNGSDEQMTKD